MDQYPQLFAYESPEGYPAEVPNMMVVGGIGTDGALSRGSSVDPPNRGDVIKVYAPSQELTVPNAITGNYREGEASGISLGKHICSDLKSFSTRTYSSMTNISSPSLRNSLRTWGLFSRAFKSFHHPS